MVPVVLNIPAPCLHKHEKMLLAGCTHYSCWEQLGRTDSIGSWDQVLVCLHGEKSTRGSSASKLKRILIYLSFISFIEQKIIPWNEAAFRCLSGPPAWAVSFPSQCLLCQYTTKYGALPSHRAGPSSLHVPWLAGGTSSTWHQHPCPTFQAAREAWCWLYALGFIVQIPNAFKSCPQSASNQVQQPHCREI